MDGLGPGVWRIPPYGKWQFMKVILRTYEIKVFAYSDGMALGALGGAASHQGDQNPCPRKEERIKKEPSQRASQRCVQSDGRLFLLGPYHLTPDEPDPTP